ncbi:MAG: thioredoxin TrxA [Cyanophyceae cyanobacterium]
MGQVLTIRDADFEREVLQAKGTVLAYFWAQWCGPCRLMGPSIDWAASAYAEGLKVVKLEVDPNPESVKRCQVEGVPALLLHRNGELIDRSEGAISREKLAAFLAPHLGATV